MKAGTFLLAISSTSLWTAPLWHAFGRWIDPSLESRRHGAPLHAQHQEPEPWEVRANQFWREEAERESLQLSIRFKGLLEQAIHRSVTLLPREEAPKALEVEDEAHGGSRYGTLPQMRVDQGHGAIFPPEPRRPSRFSWIALWRNARSLADELTVLESELKRAETPLTLSSVLSRLLGFRDGIRRHARMKRYLETWSAPLLHQQDREIQAGRPSTGTLLSEALREADSSPQRNHELREHFRPRRVIPRSFLPSVLPRPRLETVTLPIRTDIRDRGFRAETEAALETHWNQSPWARKNRVQFKIRWFEGRSWDTRQPFSLEKHLKQLAAPSTSPEKNREELLMTTGGPSTFVQGRALVLGPGELDGRTLAHEIGHLIGFSDCYFRTLSGQGLSGLAILEWENPYFPDELMCDNQFGSVNEARW
jgi:hypothetical protein